MIVISGDNGYFGGDKDILYYSNLWVIKEISIINLIIIIIMIWNSGGGFGGV